ncbi:HigA family addiction module antitoxin [Shumkonia mesophila]|uniref:HigA family addiction module antitoxin n=1 Tax=Shumkonia mesophila TaxID=2838854 RepID=UPI0029345742|nr:HigA family addiction module antitoxin [Shumkonia mesophila]
MAKKKTATPPIHPGEILKEEFLIPHGLNANRLAVAIGVAPNRITGILNGRRAISGETAILLARAFGTTPEFWINLQAHYDLELARLQVTEERVQGAASLARELRVA